VFEKSHFIKNNLKFHDSQHFGVIFCKVRENLNRDYSLWVETCLGDMRVAIIKYIPATKKSIETEVKSLGSCFSGVVSIRKLELTIKYAESVIKMSEYL
jgi:hypothetical protein